MAEREIDQTDPGTAVGGGTPAWLTNPRATPPAPEPGYQWLWYTGDQSPRWIYVPTTWTPPRPATDGTTTDATTPTGFARADRDRLTWGNTGRMEGFEVGSTYGGDLKARNSVKNTFGRIASRYASKPSSIDLILADPDFKRAFPNAKKAGFDKIDFGGVQSDFESGVPVGVIDVLTSADPTTDTARGWWWGADAGAAPTSAPTSAASATAGTSRPQTSLYDSEAWQNQYGRPSLSRSSEERGWKTLAELGFAGEGADETPDDIYRRNQQGQTTNNAEFWDMNQGVQTPRYAPRNYGGVFRNFVLPVGLMAAGMVLGPKWGTTLAGLAQNRRQPGRGSNANG